MACVMSSESVILTTAMAVSGAVIYLSLSGIRNSPSAFRKLSCSHSSNPNSSSSLRSCLFSGEKRREKNKKKKVKFADHVKVKRIEMSDNNRNYGRKIRIEDEISENEKNQECSQMPANQAALYHGILRDRVHRHSLKSSF